MKHFLTSKINWVGIITALIGVLGLTSQLQLSDETMKWVALVTGILTIVLRTFFTSTPVSLSTPKGDI